MFHGFAFAADEYHFELQYSGTIMKDVEKDAKVLLVGKNGPTYTNVLIKVKVTGPATPKLLATDTNGVEHDIAQVGYWGPPTGFPIQGDFTNTTPIKATFPKEGKYTIELSLVDVSNSNAVIASKTFDLEVAAETAPPEQPKPPAPPEEPKVEELPKTGIGIGEIVMYICVLGTVMLGVVIYFNRKRIHN